MPPDLSQILLEKVALYTVGFVRIGAGEPTALGSGVAMKVEGTVGILTCGHVEDVLRSHSRKTPIGMARFTHGESFQSRTLKMDVVDSLIMGEPPWNKGQPDLCFLTLTPDQAASVASRFVILDATKNFSMMATKPPSNEYIDAAFGLIEEYSGPDTHDNGLLTKRMRGVVTPGKVVEISDNQISLECRKENIPDLPGRFGGLSGGGLWRAYFRFGDNGDAEIEQLRFLGIASQDDLTVSPPRILCQGLGRIDYVLRRVVEK